MLYYLLTSQGNQGIRDFWGFFQDPQEGEELLKNKFGVIMPSILPFELQHSDVLYPKKLYFMTVAYPNSKSKSPLHDYVAYIFGVWTSEEEMRAWLRELTQQSDTGNMENYLKMLRNADVKEIRQIDQLEPHDAANVADMIQINKYKFFARNVFSAADYMKENVLKENKIRIKING